MCRVLFVRIKIKEDYRIGSVLRHRSGCCVLRVSGTLWIGDSLINLCEIRGFIRKGVYAL